MNLGTMRTQVAAFIGDPDQTRFTAAQYLDAINRAQEQFALETRSLWKDKSWSHAADDADEDLPSDFMWESYVTYDGKELIPISRHELNRQKGDDWASDTGTPTHFIIDPEEAVKKIVLYPIPQEAKTLIMRYFPLPAALSSDSDTPLNSSALMVQFHIGIAAFAAWLLLLGEEQTPAIVQKRREFERLYADAVSKAVDSFKNTASAPLELRGRSVWY